MVPSPDLERFAAYVAENVVSAIEHALGLRLAPEEWRARAVSGLMREMLAAMPTASGAALADACNRVLARLPDQGETMPRVAAVNMADGSVTMSPSLL